MVQVGNAFLLFLWVVLYEFVTPSSLVTTSEELAQNQSGLICPDEEILSGNRTLKWHATVVGETALPEEVCVDEDEEIMTRGCETLDGVPVWSQLKSPSIEEYTESNLTKDFYNHLKQIYKFPIEINTANNIYRFSNRFEEFEIVDYIILFECLHIMRTQNASDKLNILINILSSLKNNDDLDISDEIFSVIMDSIKEHLTNESSGFTNITLTSPNIVIKAWKPFYTNITGTALYNYTENNYAKSNFTYIYATQSSRDIDTENLETAAYVPYHFLNELISTTPSIVRKNLYIVMMLVNNDTFSQWDLYTTKDINNIISVSIPDFCKKNKYPLLQAFFKPDSKDGWIEFGSDYFDSSNDPTYKCVLSQFSYVAYRFNNAQNRYFESVKSDYCLPTTITTNASEIHIQLEQISVGRVALPQNFCIDKNVKIPAALCRTNNTFQLAPFSAKKCVSYHPVSKYTQHIYKMARECWNINEVDEIFGNDFNYTKLTYVDKILLVNIIWCFLYYTSDTSVVENINFIPNLFDKFYSNFDNVPREVVDLVHTSSPLRFYYELISFDYNTPYLVIKPKFIYFVSAPFTQNIVGLVLYKIENGSSFLSYKIRYLATQNVSEDYSEDVKVELIAYITNESLSQISNNLSTTDKTRAVFAITVLYTYDVLDPSHSIKSRIVGVHKGRFGNRVDMNVRVYLKVTHQNRFWKSKYTKHEGHWSTIQLKRDEITFAFVSANEGDECEGANKVTTLQISNLQHYKVTRSKMKRRKDVDIISQVSMSVNKAKSMTNMERIYRQHSEILKLIMHIGGGLSCFGIVIIFLSALFLKNWHKKRFYSIQLCFVLICQDIFFVINTSTISTVTYILFYYSILAQFTWMTIIGYTQYIKFIEIFKGSQLTICKSLALGWLTPAVITIISVAIYRDCFNCNLCIRNSNIFMYFVITPICLVIVANIVIYVFILINISRSKLQRDNPSTRTNRKRAIFLLAFMLGISWIFIFALISPWMWLTLTGCYLFHIIAPSQGFVLFVFIVALDHNTRNEWRSLCQAPIESFSSTISTKCT